MLKLHEWSENLDLSYFYEEARRRGFENNSSQKRMIDTFKKEKEWKAWILYNDARAIASVVAHSFDDIMGPGSYRILARTCVLEGVRKNGGLMTARTAIAQHQNITDQFLIPACLNWSKGESYSTSNNSPVASQRMVHKYYFPILEEIGIVENVGEVYYRNTIQTVWKIHKDKFFNSLEKYPKWT